MIKSLRELEPGDWIKWRGQWVEVETIDDDYGGSAWLCLSGKMVSFPSHTRFRVQDWDDDDDDDDWRDR